MSTPPDETPHEPLPGQHDDPVVLEDDETVPPRPEEEIADQLRAEPS